MYKADFDVGKYISIEKSIEDTKADYYWALQESSFNWMNKENDLFTVLGLFFRCGFKRLSRFQWTVEPHYQTDLLVDKLSLKVIQSHCQLRS